LKLTFVVGRNGEYSNARKVERNKKHKRIGKEQFIKFEVIFKFLLY
jgi:hypothetical protein